MMGMILVVFKKAYDQKQLMKRAANCLKTLIQKNLLYKLIVLI